MNVLTNQLSITFFSLLWNCINLCQPFFVDGKSVYTFVPENKSKEVWPYDQPFYFIINTAVGGNFGGPDVDDTIFPQEFIIDYVKVYSN